MQKAKARGVEAVVCLASSRCSGSSKAGDQYGQSRVSEEEGSGRECRQKPSYLGSFGWERGLVKSH